VKLRQLWKLLSGVALLVTGLLWGASAPTAASTGGCAGDVVVALDVAVWSRSGHDTHAFTLAEPLPAGTWRVTASSSDAYEGRSESDQAHEQWRLDLGALGLLGPTTDLADGVESASVTDVLGTFETTDGLSRFTVRHAVPSTPGGTNSVTAECLAFSRVVPPTTTTAPPTTVPSTTVPATTVPATTVPTTTVPTTTVPSTTVPTTTSPSTTLPPTTVPPTTVPPTTVPPTTVPVEPEPRPADVDAVAVVDCAVGEVLVLVGNDGELDATVDVALPKASVHTDVVVDGGTATTSSLAIGDLTGATEIRVSDATTGALIVAVPIDIECADPALPSASTVFDCPGDVLVVVLVNDGGDDTLLRVIHERVALVDEVVLAPADTVQVEIPLDGADRLPVRVVDDTGVDVLRLALDNPCPAPPPGEPDPAPGRGDGEVPDGDDGPVDGPTPAACVEGADAAACATVRVVVEPDCPRSLADVGIRREGVGRERFVVLVDGVVAGVVAIEGSGRGTVPVRLGPADAELTVSRSTSTDAITVGTLSCGSGDSRAGPIAASLVVFAVLSTAAGVMPWPIRPGAG
jgi:hypothetical protein